MNWKNLDTILKNERYYRNIITIHLNENKNNGDDLGVQNNSFGNSKERNVINRIEDRQYKKAVKIVRAIEHFYEYATELEIMIFEYKYKHNLLVFQIAGRTHYSERTVRRNIRKIREYFKMAILV